jgi:hypothetical protein
MSSALLRLPLASRVQLDDREAMRFSIGQIGTQEKVGFPWEPDLFLLMLLDAG